jgi:hypothetical protein
MLTPAHFAMTRRNVIVHPHHEQLRLLCDGIMNAAAISLASMSGVRTARRTP